MKKKKILLKLFIILMLAWISGCANETHDEQDKEEIGEEIIQPEIVKSKNEYDNLWYISENKILYLNDSKYGVIDYNENVLIEADYDYGVNFISENKFLLGNYNGDNYECYLYDENLNIIFTNEKYPSYTIAYVNEGVVVLTNKSLNEYIYLDMNLDYKELFTLNESVVPGFMLATAYDNGYALVVSEKYTDDGYQNLYDKDGNVHKLKYDNKIIYTYFGCAVGEDGWVVCYLLDLQDANNNQKGFYNIGNDTFVKMPENLQQISPIKDNKGIAHATYNNYALIKENINTDEVYIFDILNEKIINTEPFSYVDINSNNKILYSKNNKWGYLNDDYQENSSVYNDATSYSEQGYALINDNGSEYLINLDEIIVSEAMIGSEATQENGLFVIQNGNKKYFITIK